MTGYRARAENNRIGDFSVSEIPEAESVKQRAASTWQNHKGNDYDLTLTSPIYQWTNCLRGFHTSPGKFYCACFSDSR